MKISQIVHNMLMKQKTKRKLYFLLFYVYYWGIPNLKLLVNL